MRFLQGLLMISAVIGVCAGAAPSAALAASVLDQHNDFVATYGVYGGGIQALAIDVGFDFNKTTYVARMDAKPYGALGKLLPWAGHYVTDGVVKKGALIPGKHDRTSAWRDDKSRMFMSYNVNGVLTKMEQFEDESGQSSHKELPLDAALHKGTLDLPTAITDMLVTATDKKTCNYAHDVFDGKRRFALTFKDEGTVKIPPSNVNIFSGAAYVCRMELVPQKGFTGKPRGFYRIQEAARKKGELPVVWLGRAWNGGPIIPVRMMIKSEFGTVLVHLKNIRK